MRFMKAFLGFFLIPFFALAFSQSQQDRIEKLIEQLGNDNSYLVFKIANELSTIGEPAVEPLLLELMDEFSSYRLGAANALGRIKDTRAVEPLIKIVSNRNENYHLRSEAIRSLGIISDAHAVDALIDALKEKSPFLRAAAAHALGNIADHAAVKPLIAALHDEQAMVIGAALKSLGQIKDVRVIEPVIELLDKKELYLDREVFNVLERIGSLKALEKPLFELLHHKKERIRNSSVELLNKLGWKPKSVIDQVAYSIAMQDWDKCIESSADFENDRGSFQHSSACEGPSGLVHRPLDGERAGKSGMETGVSGGEGSSDGCSERYRCPQKRME